MSEGVYNKIQLGRQTSIGTAVAATTLFPVDAGFLGFELDRASESPDEDFGRSSREQTGRGSTGVRLATASLPFTGRFEDFMHPLEMHVAGIGTPVGTGTAVWGYGFDETADTLKNYTFQYGVAGSTQDEWRAYGVIANELQFGFDALSAPGNSMWKGTLGLVAVSREVNTLTAAINPPATLETMEGHLTTLAEGTATLAYASLPALPGSLKSFSLTSTINASGRAYGSTSGDTITAWGRSAKGTAEFDAVVAINATAKTDIHDIFAVASGLTVDRRWRITCTGTGVNLLTLDFRCRFQTVNVADHEDERLYGIHGVCVYDSTLLARTKFTLTNAVATIP